MWSNWSKNVKIDTHVARPTSIEELSVLATKSKIGLVARGHSFNEQIYGENLDMLVDLSNLGSGLSLECDRSEVSVGPSTTLRELALETSKLGFQLNNYPSRLDFSVVGSIVTGSHGSGQNSCLSSMVTAFTLMEYGSGSITEYKKDHTGFHNNLILSSRIGIVTSLTLQVSKSISYCRLTFGGLDYIYIPDLIQILTSRKSLFSVYLNLRDSQRNSLIVTAAASDIEELSLCIKQNFPNVFIGTVKSRGLQVKQDIESREFGFAHELIPHSSSELPQFGEELQSEYFFMINDFETLYFSLLHQFPEGLLSLVRSIEIRYIEKSDCLFSPSFDSDVFAFHFTWRNDPKAVASGLIALESLLLRSIKSRGGFMRVHWGKLFSGSIRRWFETFETEGIL